MGAAGRGGIAGGKGKAGCWAGRYDVANPPCGKCGFCLCADARIAMLCVCRRAAAREWGDGLAGAHKLDGCLGKEPACADPRCFSST